MYQDALPQFGIHVIGLAKPAHPHRGKTRCRPKDSVFRDHENLRFSNDAGPVSRPREGADAHGHTRHGSNRRPLLRWHSRCVRVLSVPRESPQGRARAKLNSPPVVSLASRQRPRRSHGPPRPWYFTERQARLRAQVAEERVIDERRLHPAAWDAQRRVMGRRAVPRRCSRLALTPGSGSTPRTRRSVRLGGLLNVA
jgi:hypothetical protein